MCVSHVLRHVRVEYRICAREEECARHDALVRRHEDTRKIQRGEAEEQTTIASEVTPRSPGDSKATLTVGPGCTYSTLQAAIDATVSGDDIWIQETTLVGTAALANINDKSLLVRGGANSDCSALTTASSILDANGLSDSVIEFMEEPVT
jgi:hypothetical protein